MSYIGLVGLDKDKIDNYLIGEHAVVEEVSELYEKGIMNMNLFNVAQRSLMNAAGYSVKNLRKMGDLNLVSFEENIFPHSDLLGKGKTELEAICDACKNYVNNPRRYNLNGEIYFDYLKLLSK